MARGTAVNKNNFNRLLEWLDPDRNAAGRKYESIRLRLLKIFYARGAREAEDLADETIERVTARIESIADGYEGDPALYFYGVAKNVFRENTRKPRSLELSENLAGREPDTDRLERNDRCLEKCLRKLPDDKREFIIRYYTREKQAKIDLHKKMSEELGLTAENLRVRAFRLRKSLQKCVFECLEA